MNMTKQPSIYDCPNGSKDHCIVVFETKAHLPACKFRRIVVKDYETLFVITDTRSYTSLNSRVKSLGP